LPQLQPGNSPKLQKGDSKFAPLSLPLVVPHIPLNRVMTLVFA
jgi:hypothetical protein